MEGDFVHWQQSWADLRRTEGEASDSYTVIPYDMLCSPLTTDPANMGLAPLISTECFPQPAFDMSNVYNPFTIPAQENTSINPRQQSSQQLYIDTRLDYIATDDPEASTASSTSVRQAVTTPYSQGYSNFQPHVRILSPQSAPAEIGTLMPDFEKMLQFPPSPLSLCSPAGEGDFDFSTPSFPTEPDVVTHSPLPHILEWKRVIQICGTKDFVPQMVYQPYTEADKKRYIHDVVLQETIFFIAEGSDELGIPIDDALKVKLKYLKGKEDRMFIGCGPSVSIRIQWPGYQPWSKQIPTQDFKTPKGPITRAKLAKNIATCLRRFAESVQDKPMEADSDKRWKIGKSHIKVEDLILVSLHHVSKGSWQPQLRIRRSF